MKIVAGFRLKNKHPMVIPLGYPANEGSFHATTERRALDQIVSAEMFGNL